MVHLGVGAFDIDGTLMHHPARPDFLSSRSLSLAKPCPHTTARVRTLIELGMDIHFITGRAEPVRSITLAQLRAYVHPSIRDDRLHTQEKFTGYDAMSKWKAGVLLETRSQWFVGDHDADELAAKIAGVPFQYANEYHELSRASPWAVV